MQYRKHLCFFIIIMAIVMAFSGSLAAEGVKKINLNTSSLEELTQLQKIGTKTAGRIIEYREKNGLFKNPEDIVNVKGVGQKIWELNKDRITVGE